MLLGVRDAPPAGLRLDRAPAGVLAGAVLGYRGYHECSQVASDRWETPSGDVILVIGLADPFLMQERQRPPASFTSFVVGLQEQPIPTRYAGRQLGVQVRLAPPAVAALLGVPAGELTNRVVALADLIGDEAERWAAMLASAGSWPGLFAVLDGILGLRMRAAGGRSLLGLRAWEALRRAEGDMRIDDLVAYAGCSHRHLIEMFRREVGLTPKRAARVLRYESAARRLRDHPVSPAAVALACGYTDQAHLTREFRRFSGITPGQLSTRP